MKLKNVLVILFCMLSILSGMAQVTFDKGYIVDNDGKTTYCFIKNMDWGSNPKKIQYKTDENSHIQTADIKSIKEFGVDNYSRYIRTTVEIDRSPYEVGELSSKSDPKWSEETLFLKEIVCGKASLYTYEENVRQWFFYSIDNSLPKQLIYKRYIENDFIKTNSTYYQQLARFVQNEYTQKANFKDLSYREKDLVKYFKTYNQIADYCPEANLNQPKRERFNLKLEASISENKATVSSFNFGNKINWEGGIEFEYYYPHIRNTLSLLFNPTYKHLNINKDPYSLVLTNLDLPIGIRYYKYFNTNSRLFAEAYISATNIDLGSEVKGKILDLKENLHFIFGVGYTYKNIALEYKFNNKGNISNDYLDLSSSYLKYSLSISYKFYKLIK